MGDAQTIKLLRARCEQLEKSLMDKSRILVILNADGFVEVYGGENVLVHVCQKLDVPPRPESEIKCEEIARNDMPFPYRELYQPGNLRWQGMIESETPTDRLERESLWRMHQALDEMIKKAQPVES